MQHRGMPHGPDFLFVLVGFQVLDPDGAAAYFLLYLTLRARRASSELLGEFAVPGRVASVRRRVSPRWRANTRTPGDCADKTGEYAGNVAAR